MAAKCCWYWALSVSSPCSAQPVKRPHNPAIMAAAIIVTIMDIATLKDIASVMGTMTGTAIITAMFITIVTAPIGINPQSFSLGSIYAKSIVHNLPDIKKYVFVSGIMGQFTRAVLSGNGLSVPLQGGPWRMCLPEFISISFSKPAANRVDEFIVNNIASSPNSSSVYMGLLHLWTNIGLKGSR